MAFMRQRSQVSSKLSVVFEIGDLVQLSKKRQGVIKFVGQLHNRDGVWYGLELTDDTKGDNSGNMGKKQYFECQIPGKGVFVKPKELLEIISKSRKESKQVTTVPLQGIDEKQPHHHHPRLRAQDTVPAPPDMNMSDEEYPMDDVLDSWEPSRSPSEQIRRGGHSNLLAMLQKVPKNQGKSRVHLRKYSNKDTELENALDRGLGSKVNAESDTQKRQHLEREIERLQMDLERVCETEMESKRIQIKTELDNLRPIELVEKLSEYISRNTLKAHEIEMLQKMINFEQH